MTEPTTTADWALQRGVPGVLVVVTMVLGWAVWHLWNELKAARIDRDKLYELMLSEARANTATLLTVNEKVHVAIDRITDLVEKVSGR